ncbi:MAG: iron ABC transporter permease [Phycisphaerales bacterium]
MNRTAAVLACFAAALVVVCTLRLLATGDLGHPLGLSSDAGIMSIRATRLLSALAVGGALGAAGVILQTLLRNPLASPDVVGVSAGAGLGVMINHSLSATGVLSASLAASAAWQLVPAAVGAGAVLLLLIAAAGWTLTRSARPAAGADPASLLLTGVVISVLCGAGVTFLQYFRSDSGFSTARVLAGSLSEELSIIAAAVAAALVWVAIALLSVLGGRSLDALTLSHDEAVSVGVNVGRVRLLALLATGLLCAGAVVVAGPIGFVGLIAPHAVRAALGPARATHGPLIVAAALAGALIVVAADTLVRTINLAGGRMPLGILTALAGAPTLLYLLRKDARARH